MSILASAFALLLLNGALTVENAWPTPWVRPSLAVAPELAAIVLPLALIALWRGVVGWGWRALATLTLLLLIGGHYAVVTNEGLFGRTVNLYWEMAHVPNAFALLLDAESPLLVLARLAGALVAFGLLVLIIAWCVGAIVRVLTVRRWALGTAIAATLLLVAYGGTTQLSPGVRIFAEPVAPAYARQAMMFADHSRNPESPAVASAAPLTRVSGRGLAGSDVFLMFFESYGATVFDSPGHRQRLALDYDALDILLANSPWQAVSAYVDSTTFGGASWLAHASLLSGVPISDQRDYLSLLASERSLLTHRFQEAGYRTVALVPGIRQNWPESAVLGFDKVYDAAALDYTGPRFGWWEIPDQYSLSFLHKREIAGGRQPLLVFHASVMSHIPFAPTPPYVADWARATEPAIYQANPVVPASGPDGPTNGAARGENYVRAIRYNLSVLAGFLQQRAPEDALIVVLGDHQPPALVAGAGASWSVPVHVFATRDAPLAAFREAGFQPGTRPERPVVGDITQLTRILLSAAGGA